MTIKHFSTSSYSFHRSRLWLGDYIIRFHHPHTITAPLISSILGRHREKYRSSHLPHFSSRWLRPLRSHVHKCINADRRMFAWHSKFRTGNTISIDEDADEGAQQGKTELEKWFNWTFCASISQQRLKECLIFSLFINYSCELRACSRKSSQLGTARD